MLSHVSRCLVMTAVSAWMYQQLRTLVTVCMMCDDNTSHVLKVLVAVAYSTECEYSLMYKGPNKFVCILQKKLFVAACSLRLQLCCRHNSPWDGKSPNSIAAAIIYMVTQLPAATNKPSTTTIALECSIAEGTLQSTYRDLYTERAVLIPKWFAKTEDLQHLQQPRERY